ncbi:hypothetical protein [Desulfuromonas thiophila]|nr:hypothetical protein [Desulfuromonas thiophila]
MSTTTDYFQQAELALASYATLYFEISGKDYTDALKDNGDGMSQKQAETFTTNWRVIDQYDGKVEETYTDEFGQEQTFLNPTGLSATVFESIADGKRYLAVRGTEITDLNDIVADGGILLHGIPDQSAQYQALKSKVEQWQQTGVLSGSFSVTGHSLGGWLAGGLMVDFASSVDHAYFYNAPGVFGAAGELIDLFNQTFGTDFLALDLAQISNIRASVGISPIAGLGESLAPVVGIEIEDHKLGNHFIKYLTDSLAVYNLFSQIDASLTLSSITSLLETSANKADHTLESAVSALGKLFATGFTPRTGKEYDIKRDDLYTDIDSITNVLGDTSGLSIEVMATTDSDGEIESFSPSDIKTRAQSDIAYRYALVNLNPFAVVGADYSNFNQNGELDIFDPATGEGQLSDSYLTDRAEMLANLIYCNIHDTTDAGGDGSPILYTDIRIGEDNIMIQSGKRESLFDQARYTFGSKESDPLLPGTSNNDHLYGMGGNDTLDGKGGDDWLEGGKGQDTLNGGAGDDVYVYAPGDGKDIIIDTETSDSGTNHIVICDLDLSDAAIESYYGNASLSLYTFTDSTYGLSFEWNPLSQTMLITGTALSGTTTSTDNSMTINDIDNPNQLLERFGINLTFCLEAALALDTTNPFTLQNYIADDLSSTLTEWGSLSFSLGVNQALSSGDKIVIQVSGSIDSSVLALVYKGQQLDFVNGEITIDIIEGQSLFAFALLQQGELVADASAAITATLITVDDDGNEMEYDILNALNISVEDNNFITGTAAAPVTTRDIVGDMSPVDADPDQEGMQYSYDDLGNVVTDDNSETRDDILYDSSANDTIISGEGDDTVYLNRGGEDVVELGEGDDWLLVESEHSERIIADGGDGRDYLDGGQNGDVLKGGSGADLLHGNSGDDLLFGDHEGDCENFILNGATEEASGVKGDLMDAADGNDQIFTGAGNDFIAAGSGDDLIVTGGGDDFIRGDQNIHSPDWKNWGLTSNITTDANGSTTYTYTYSNLAVEDGSGSGNDTVYAGAGNDTVFGENGDDTIFLEAGDDISWGGAGTDIVLGGAGDDMINGDNGVAQLPEALHGDDFLDGGIGNDKLYGMGGSDILFGGAGDDNLYGDSSEQQSGGNDYLNGEEGNDTLIGAAGNDTLVGGSGNDLLLGLEDNDVLMGGTGDDELQGGDGNDYLWGEEDTDILFGGDGEDVLSGGAGNDELQGGVGNDQLYGDDGDDLLFGMEDDDSLYGGTGDDQLVGGNGCDLLNGNDGADSLWGGEDNDLLLGGTGSDELQGGDGEDILNGNEDADILLGDEGNDLLYGGSGNDQLQGGVGADILYGEENDDILFGEEGNDLLFGGSGDDQLYGNDGADILMGGDGDDLLLPGSGADIMNGGQGNDIYYYDMGSGIKHLEDDGGYDRLVLRGGINLSSLRLSLGSLMINSGTEGDELHLDGVDYSNLAETSPIDIVEFSNGQAMDMAAVIEAVGIDHVTTEDVDAVTGTSVRDNINALAGNDVIDGRGGNDVIDLGAGDDYAHGGDGNDSAQGGSGMDTIYGDAGDDTLNGGADNDTLFGGAGNDLLDGGSGSDTMTGGDGDDTYYVDSDTDTITEDADAGDDLVVSTIDYVLGDNLENLQLAEELTAVSATGNSLNNRLEGNSLDNTLLGFAGDDELFAGAGDDILDGGAGADTMNGGDGNDQYLVDDAADTIVEGAATGTDLVTSTVSYTLADNVENLVLSGTEAVTGIGNDSANAIYGNDMNNALIGGGGGDYLVGGAGDDIYDVDDASDVVIENADEGIDTIESTVDYTLADHVENLTLSGEENLTGTGNDLVNILIGNAGDNALSGGEGDDELYGGAGADTLTGGSGSDTLYGEAGDDTYVIDSIEDTLVELADEGNDTVESSVDYTLIDHIENLALTGSATTAVGNALDNSLTGNDLDNSLDGGSGDDVLSGGDGDDTYFTDASGDQIIEDGYAGDDTEIRSYESTTDLADNVENLTLANGILTGIGNALDNVLTGNDEDNTLSGGEGNDYLDGGAGSDVLEGGAGNDIYVINDGDTITEYADKGTDTVETAGDIILGANLENVVLTGDAVVNATGNELNNLLIGNSAANILDGGSGGDELIGGDGDDIYYTDSESDVITESADQGTDTEIRSHESLYLLSANVENLILTGAVYRGNGNELDNVINGNDSDNNLWGREGHDTLCGNGGDDQLIGADGNDVLYGGTGSDLMSGGAGDDTLVGGDGADQLDGGGGTNTLRGGLGDDIYVYGADGGVSTIDNSDGGIDWLLFTDDITSDRLAHLRDGDDLIVRVDDDAATQVVVSNWFLGEEYQLSYIQPANASGISAWTINRMFPPENPEADGITTPDSNSFDMLWYGTSSGEQLIGTDGADLIRTYQGEDSLFGLDGDDWLLGGSDTDYLDGGAGNDLLFGGDSNDQLGGGSGDDTLIGGAGDDIYVYGAGSGADSIDNSGGGTDWLIFTDGITSARLIYLQDGDDLIVQVDNDETTQVTISNWFLDSSYKVDYIQPDGEYGISATQIETLLAAGSSDFDTVIDGTDSAEQLVGTSGSDQLNAYAGDDQLFGLAGVDELNGGDGADYLDGGDGDDIQSGGAGDDQLGGDAGNDTLIGGTGDDIYVYASSSGADTIDNSDGGTDWLIFTDITGDRLSYLQDGDDLIIRVDADAATQVTITNWFVGSDYQLAYVQPYGESAISAATITALFDAGEEEGGSEIPAASAFDSVTTGTDSAEQLVGTSGMNLLQGLAGDDQLFGLSGDDWLVAGDGSDYLDGGAGNDVQLGGAGSDQLGGDAGNDLLIGGADDDIYVYRAGSGADTIDNSGGGTDWLIFTDDITANRLGYHRSGDDLLVKIDGDETTMVTVKHWFDGGDYKLSYIQPSGSYGISATTIESLLSTTPDSGFDTLVTGTDSADTLSGASTADQLRGYDGDDQLSGLDGDDELSGDDGNDLLYGGAGNDTYLFNLGDGSDSLYDASGTDSILFGDEVTADGFALFMNGDTLRIGYGTDDVITLADYSDSSTGNRIEALTLADGSYLSDSDITQIIQDISAYATAEGIAMTCLDDVRQNDELMTIISSAWDVFA